MKITLLGYSGSGKSTLAAYLSKAKQIPVLHLDTVQFIENWQEREYQEALVIVKNFMLQNSWVIDGNYTKFYQEERLAEADQIILLLFSPLVSLRRVINRRIKYQKKKHVRIWQLVVLKSWILHSCGGFYMKEEPRKDVNIIVRYKKNILRKSSLSKIKDS